MIIKWFNRSQRCLNYILTPLLDEVLVLKSYFNQIFACHIYRERHCEADLLSKEGVQQDMGLWVAKEFDGELVRDMDQPPFSR